MDTKLNVQLDKIYGFQEIERRESKHTNYKSQEDLTPLFLGLVTVGSSLKIDLKIISKREGLPLSRKLEAKLHFL